MNFVGTSLILLAAIAVIFAPRRFAVLVMFVSVGYISQAQTINVGGFNFFAHRIILLAGFVRIMARGELKKLKLNKIDKALFAFAILSAVVPGIRLGVWQEAVGGTYNILLSYFLFRCLVVSWEDIQQSLPHLAILVIPLALCMIYEHLTGSNVFDVMGVRVGSGWLREDRIRCIGAFRGPHTAGIYGATLVPLFVSLLYAPGQRGVAIAGLVAAVAITLTSNSSGPLMGFLSGLIALAFWPLRRDMRRVRWGIVASLVGLALLMKPPIWYIFSKISQITGGDGWSRSYLMEQCFNHMSDWWLLGTDNTIGWASTGMPWGGADLCNLYVSCAAGAGMGGLFFLILLLVRCFSYLGLALHEARTGSSEAEALLWCCGCVLFAHVCILFSVTYWDQLFVTWWGFLAMISSATSNLLERARATELGNEQVNPILEMSPAKAPAIG